MGLLKSTFLGVISVVRWCFHRIIDLILPKSFVATRIDLRIKNLPRRFDGTKLVHITDIHYNGNGVKLVSNELLRSLVDFVNNEPNVNLLVFTGDYVQKDPTPIRDLCLDYLSKMNLVREGKAYACLGNHDCVTHSGKESIASNLENVGIRVLRNQLVFPFLKTESASLDDGQPEQDTNFVLVGLGDLWAGEFHPDKVMNDATAIAEKASTKDETPAVVVLSHNPDTAARLSNWRMTLQLSGHTHGGQICVPFTHRPLLQYLAQLPSLIRVFVPKGFVNCVRKWTWGKGLSRIASQNERSFFYLYTASGLASHAGLRVFCPPEIAVITLLRDDSIEVVA